MFSDPLDPYHVLLLGSAKLELYDFLKENRKNTEETLLSELLEESRNCLLVCASLQNDEDSKQVSNLITG